MSTNQPVELGKVSEETKQMGPAPSDSLGSLIGDATA
jgi:hypothetical protein